MGVLTWLDTDDFTWHNTDDFVWQDFEYLLTIIYMCAVMTSLAPTIVFGDGLNPKCIFTDKTPTIVFGKGGC